MPGRRQSPNNTPTRLRQIALVVKDLEQARRELTHVIGTEVIFEDPAVAQFGLKNFLVPIGGDIIEVVSPVQNNTTAGRLLEKRGDGGYMIIMQTEDAKKRREHIEANQLSKVIWGYENDDVACVQYHPKGLQGGMMVELDSHASTKNNPTPLKDRFSPWHACGPDYAKYSEGMKRTSHLNLEGCVLRLAPGDLGHEAAARRWEEVFGVGRSRDLLAFTNARLGFVRGQDGEREGLVSVTVGVNGTREFHAILDRADKAGLCGDGWINMCGVKFYFTLTGHGQAKL
ncbi:hypothetical protein DPSP01_009919 [Paraphaeosphaeria sporulosa]|uniref:Glyoxalase-like domain-containing protein n=1 Tax=Paraphaeosphaeria sporulosa TaxID=1460663 RepID=A0A177C009_9PLEO|nr:uncharacterized protein CC84DRAFT_1156036 [Paraphaeosphaeria sporulosa]OAG00037.1 hypothetical protein CC84DRAFT_1156036 [Paraphaeosphaeria sporulosa]